jgi:short-subunit dehydrogenase
VSDSPKPAQATPLNPRRRGIIIGASDGIGAALARKLTKEGYTLALIARRKDKLNALCTEINASVNETRALAYVHDVSNYNEVPTLLRRSAFRVPCTRTSAGSTWLFSWQA